MTGSRSEVSSIRVIPELRADHVKRDSALTPAETLFFASNPDLVGTRVPASMRQVTTRAAVAVLWRSSARTLEVPEPLWVRFLVTNLILIWVWKARNIFRRDRRVVTYAIENNFPVNVVTGRESVPPAVGGAIRVCLAVVTRISIDRIVFGSSGSRDAYLSLPGVSSIESVTIEALPAPAPLMPSETSESEQRVVFVGMLEGRKGIAELMNAWNYLEQMNAEADIVIVGDGPLLPSVERWCSAKSHRRKWLGRVPHDEVSSILEEATVLVAPSKRSGRWREQLGLPILEALSRGLTVVTSDETALATWLSSHGHTVFPAASTPVQLARILHESLSDPLDPAVVRASLPEVSGRVTADRWLHDPKRSGAVKHAHTCRE